MSTEKNGASLPAVIELVQHQRTTAVQALAAHLENNEFLIINKHGRFLIVCDADTVVLIGNEMGVAS